MKTIKTIVMIMAITFIFSSYGNTEYGSEKEMSKEVHSGSGKVGASDEIDPRSYQHGITILPRANGRYFVIWSSSGNPPKGEKEDGNWSHDVYFSDLDPRKPTIKPVTLISKPEAQEPASAAQTRDGHIMITMEEGWNVDNEVGQRFAIYDQNLKPIFPYPQMILDGGHSGHAAASGNRFIVSCSSDWVDGGGFNDLGSGKDVLASIYDSGGKLIAHKEIAVDNDRNCWPLVAGSETRALLVWQHFKTGQASADLMVSVIDPSDGKYIKAPVRIHENVKFYYYSIEYVPSIKRFLILGTDYSGNGFGYLIDNQGKITGSNRKLPPVMRESRPVIGQDKSKTLIGMPTSPAGAAVLDVTSSKISVNRIIKDSYVWQYCGTDGIFSKPNELLLFSLSTKGIIQRKYLLK